MGKILLAWEFGGGRGHILRMRDIGARLQRRGHEVSYALQRVDAEALGVKLDGDVWQSPITPRLLVNTRRAGTKLPATLGDILARLGYEDEAIVAGLLHAWQRMFAAVRPDVVVSDYAPSMMMAARGRIPLVACGTGFDLPPPELERLPSLNGQPTAYDEGEILGTINRALARAGQNPLERLAQIFTAERQMPSTFREIDPYGDQRQVPEFVPTVPIPPPRIAPGSGEEIFVYLHENMPIQAPLWDGLAASRLPVRVHVANVDAAYLGALAAKGFIVEEAPLTFDEIGRRSRLILSHGSHGFVSCGMLAGLPQIICHHDLEKLQHGLRIAAIGLGGHVALQSIKAEPFAQSLVQIYASEDMSVRARQAAAGFQRRMTADFADLAADAAESLISGQ